MVKHLFHIIANSLGDNFQHFTKFEFKLDELQLFAFLVTKAKGFSRLLASLDQRVVVGGRNEGKRVTGAPSQALVLGRRLFRKKLIKLKLLNVNR